MNTDTAGINQAHELVSIAAHDLRNPLMCIEAYTRLLMAGDRTPSERAKMQERILACSRFMRQVVDGILDSKALELGKIPMSMNAVMLPELLQRSLEVVEHSAAERGVTIVLAASSARHAVLGDAPRLQQVIVNLVSNAVKHAPSGTGKVEVRLLDLGAELVLEVADNGTGIAPEHLGGIFDKFSQAGDAKTRGSLGLGLFIARQIADFHNGRIWARSPGLGKGASFYLSLPKHDPERAGVPARHISPAPGPRLLYPLVAAGALAVMTLLLQRLPLRAPEIPTYTSAGR